LTEWLPVGPLSCTASLNLIVRALSSSVTNSPGAGDVKIGDGALKSASNDVNTTFDPERATAMSPAASPAVRRPMAIAAGADPYGDVSISERTKLGPPSPFNHTHF